MAEGKMKKSKKGGKQREIATTKEISQRIKDSASAMVKEIKANQDPSFTTMQRGKNNVVGRVFVIIRNTIAR